MKLNIEVELEWIEEDGSLDDQVKDELIRGVKQSIGKSCLEKVEKQASTAVDKAIADAVLNAEKLINDRVIKFVEDFLSKSVEVTDKWGDVVRSGTIEELVKERFDKALNTKVDSDGRPSSNGYGVSTTLHEFLIGKSVKDVVTKELSGYKSNIDKKIKEEINQGIKNNVSDLFAEMVVGVAKDRHRNQTALESSGK